MGRWLLTLLIVLSPLWLYVAARLISSAIVRSINEYQERKMKNE